MRNIELTKVILSNITNVHLDSNGTVIITSSEYPHHSVLFGVDDTDNINVTLEYDGEETTVGII